MDKLIRSINYNNIIQDYTSIISENVQLENVLISKFHLYVCSDLLISMIDNKLLT